MAAPRSSVTVSNGQVLISLGLVSGAVADRSPLLKQIGQYMVASVHRTFRDEGSPAGSWPDYAPSTLKKKQYRAGVKMLIQSGRLFGSIGAVTDADSVTIASLGVIYSTVQFLGSADRRGGSVGAQARIPGRDVSVAAHLRAFTKRKRGEDGKLRKVRGSQPAIVNVSEHRRYQNIPARNPLVVRPEDPGRIESLANQYLRQAAKGAIS